MVRRISPAGSNWGEWRWRSAALLAAMLIVTACGGTTPSASPTAAPTAAATTAPSGSADPGNACTEESVTAAEEALLEQAKTEPPLHYLTTLFPGTAEELHSAFSAKYGLEVSSTRITGAQALARLVGDNVAGNFTNSGAIGGVNPNMDPLVDSGDLLAITADNSAELFPRSCQIDQRFVGLRGLGIALYAYNASQFVVNTDLVPEDMYPESWADFLDEFWAGKIVTQDPRVITPTLGIFHALLQDYGPDYLTNWRNNVVGWHQSGATMMELVGSGENPACWCNQATYGPYTAANPDAPVHLANMTGPVLYSSSDWVVNAKSTSLASMRLLISWGFSEEGQEIINPAFGAPSLREDMTMPGVDPIPEDARLLDSEAAYAVRSTILTLLGIPD